MSNTYVYNIPIAYTFQSNDTVITKRLVNFKSCVKEVPAAFTALWNYNLCTNDEQYCQPWVKGDKIYYQYKIQDPAIKNAWPILVNSDTDEPYYTPGLNSQSYADANGNRYLNVIIDTTEVNICCFYIQINLYYADPDYDVYSACVTTKVNNGENLYQAIYECLAAEVAAGNIKYTVTEPYCQVQCDHPSTVLIEGVYPKYDCDGHYYAPWPGNIENLYRHQVRVYGEIIQQKYTFTETRVYLTKVSATQTYNWMLRTGKIPPYVAEQIAVCFNSQFLTVNGAEFMSAESLEKNNDEGNMWIINSTLTTKCNEIKFTCL